MSYLPSAYALPQPNRKTTVGTEGYLASTVVNHYIVRLNVSVHDAPAMAELESLQKLLHVVASIPVPKGGIQAAEVGVLHVLKHQGWRSHLLSTHQRVPVPYSPADIIITSQLWGCGLPDHLEQYLQAPRCLVLLSGREES